MLVGAIAGLLIWNSIIHINICNRSRRKYYNIKNCISDSLEEE